MIVKVRMLAFEDSYPGNVVIREVDVPDKEVEGLSNEELLEAVFHYGQNDFQSMKCCSVSVGDVIELGDELWRVASFGFHTITEKEFAKLLALGRRERSIRNFFGED